MQTRDPTIISIADLSSASIIWTHAEVKRFMTRPRGNPNWGRPRPPAPALATAFEIEVRQLHLMPETYTSSAELKSWCEHNRNRCYIPEWLLDAWDIDVDADLTGAP